MKLVALFFSVVVIAGALVTGLQSGSLIVLEQETPWDGLMMLVGGLTGLIVATYCLIRKVPGLGIVTIAIGIYCLFFAVYDLMLAYPQDESRYLTGLVTVIAGAAGMLIAGIFLVISDRQENDQGKVAAFIAKRIAFSRSTPGQRSFSRFIIRLSVVATIISVAVMIVTLAFANGFQATVSQKVFSFWGHIRVQEKQPYKALIAEETPILANDTVVDAIKQNPEVESIHPFATKYGILKTTDEIEGVLVKGLDSTYNFDHLRPFIIEGRPIRFNNSSYSREIILSAYTAQQLHLKVNDKILIYFIRPPDESGEQKIRPDKLTITGIYKTGIEEYDRTFAIADIRLIRKLNYWDPQQIGGYEIFLRDYKKIDAVADAVYEMADFPPDWDTQSIKNISPNIFDWLSMQDMTRNLLIGIMIVVAVINLITCLLILVLERIRMVGILKSLGAKNSTIQAIFIHHTLIITSLGIGVGSLLGLIVLYLQKETGFIKLKEEAYYLSEAAVKIAWWEIAMIGGGTFMVCLAVLTIPSILVRKIQPVKAIQFR